MTQPDPIEVFISYSHKDGDLCRELVEHLSTLRRRQVIAGWHDRQILAGEDWAGRIDEHLNSAGVILLLVSSSFLASNYCYDIEMMRAIERHDAGEAIVIPVILRACDWQGAPFSRLQALPRDARAITSWPNRDEAFADVAQGIRAAVAALQARSRPPAPVAALPTRSKPRPLLPYLCNRSEQEAALGPALRHHRQTRPRRPVVCIVHGDERESHGWFLERLRYHSLPKFLDLELRRMSVKDKPMRLPRRAGGPNAFWSNLGDALLGNTAASPDEIFDFIARHEEPLMISLDLLTDDFEGIGDGLLTAFFDFCNQWPDLPANRTVLHCVCLKYRRYGHAGWFDFKTRKLRQLNDRLRAFVEAMDFSRHAGVSGIVLPELRAIPRGDVEAWSRHDEVREFCRIEEHEIRALYERRDLCNRDGHIAMESLAEELKQMMNRAA
ncbi:MAG: TIR domain-containing protein [Burkholderiales bacterium]